MHQEQESNDEILVSIGFIILGFVFILATTYGISRRTRTFKTMVGIFVVYEVIAFIFFNIVYVRSLYSQNAHAFERRVRIEDPDNPGNHIYVSPFELEVLNGKSDGTGD